MTDTNTSLKKTFKLIDQLVADLDRPSPTRHWGRRQLLNWFLSAGVLGAVTWFLAWQWPDRARLPSEILNLHFLGLSLLWLCAFFVCARGAYVASWPGAPGRALLAPGLATGVALLFAIFTLPDDLALGASFVRELDPTRGPCGMFIALSGLTTGAFVLVSFRRAATARPWTAGLTLLAASGCLSSFFMNLICRYETPAHALLWHVLPILVIAGVGTWIGERILRGS